MNAEGKAKTCMDLRIILWDIDGTLIRSAQSGSFKDYMAPMLRSVFGTSGRLDELIVSGMTDLQIAGEALRDEGFTQEQIGARVVEISASYMREMERVAKQKDLFTCCPARARFSKRLIGTRATVRRC
ncbi:MAG: hypothetical protein WKF30_06965 [Pyrinomonadaceae bacterium]